MNDLFLYHHWQRGNKYIFSSVNDFHHYGGDKSRETGLKYVMTGEEEYRLEKKSHRVKPGHCLVVNEEQVFDIHVKKNPLPVEGLCISLDNHLLSDIHAYSMMNEEQLAERGAFAFSAEFNFFETVFAPDDVLCKHLGFLAAHLNKETGEIMFPQEELFYGLAMHLLVSQSRARQQAFGIRAVRPGTRHELFKRVNLARQQMSDEPASDKSMSELAATASMSEFHFYRTFKQAIGLSPLQYKLKVKIEKAQQLLLTTKLPLNEIASATGFADVQSFSKAFRKNVGIPPGRFRSDEVTK